MFNQPLVFFMSHVAWINIGIRANLISDRYKCVVIWNLPWRMKLLLIHHTSEGESRHITSIVAWKDGMRSFTLVLQHNLVILIIRGNSLSQSHLCKWPPEGLFAFTLVTSNYSTLHSWFDKMRQTTYRTSLQISDANTSTHVRQCNKNYYTIL